MMRIIAFALLIVAIANAGTASEKPPWLWTGEERAAALRDPAKRQQRVASYRRNGPARHAGANGADTTDTMFDEISGATNPELFFPAELFRDFVFSSWVSLPAVYPLWIRQQSKDLFRADAEWDTATAIVRPFAALLQRERQLLHAKVDASQTDVHRIDAELTRVRTDLCRAQAAAFRGLHEAFGNERFDRFLYEVVAPAKHRSVLSADDQSADAFLRKEKECL
jgi:hypothetical protein